jgi:hypothetical protein
LPLAGGPCTDAGLHQSFGTKHTPSTAVLINAVAEEGSVVIAFQDTGTGHSFKSRDECQYSSTRISAADRSSAAFS